MRILLVLASLTSSSVFAQKNTTLIETITKVHQLTPQQKQEMQAVFSASTYIGQGNPTVTQHPVSREQCQEKLKTEKIKYETEPFEKFCGGKYMVPLYPDGKKASDAKTCIDMFEFPNIPCEYPVVWVRPMEAHKICQSMGKRLCDAHEWEGACAGSLEEDPYPFDAIKFHGASGAISHMRSLANAKANANPIWAYGGSSYQKGVCGGASFKHQKCNGGSFTNCGSNTYPSGYFPKCKSKLGVFDQHGNAAEHMSLPTKPSEMTSAGGVGHTEMKGSWFIFDSFYAHKDHCRWRAPYWHGSRVDAANGHRNYHLGFRCCKSLK